MVGTAVTLKQVPAKMREPSVARYEVLIKICKPGKVIVIDAGGQTENVSWVAFYHFTPKRRVYQKQS